MTVLSCFITVFVYNHLLDVQRWNTSWPCCSSPRGSRRFVLAGDHPIAPAVGPGVSMDMTDHGGFMTWILWPYGNSFEQIEDLNNEHLVGETSVMLTCFSLQLLYFSKLDLGRCLKSPLEHRILATDWLDWVAKLSHHVENLRQTWSLCQFAPSSYSSTNYHLGKGCLNIPWKLSEQWTGRRRFVGDSS